MILRLLISLELLLLATGVARAQTAEEFFNSGAQFYISNNIPAALDKVEGGRKLYPDDVKLKKLEELLKQQQQQQQQNQKPDQNQQNQPEQQKNQQQQQSQGQQSKQSDAQKQRAEASAAREMSPAEAQRLLDAQKGDEQFLQLKPKKPPENPNKPIKDW
jgi:Mg-chelatase subunit ChlI